MAMDAGQGRQKPEGEVDNGWLENGLTFSMPGVRVAEVKCAWLGNNDLMAAHMQVGQHG